MICALKVMHFPMSRAPEDVQPWQAEVVRFCEAPVGIVEANHILSKSEIEMYWRHILEVGQVGCL